ncbi:MAG: PA14 domain-containing protein [Verrucomicrobiota bacterium]
MKIIRNLINVFVLMVIGLPPLFAYFEQNNGVYFEAYDVDLTGQNLQFTEFNNLQPTSVGFSSQVNLDKSPGGSNFAMRFSGVLYVPNSGNWTFFLDSDDGSCLYVGNSEFPLVNRSGSYSFDEGTAYLTAGFHDFHLLYYNGPGGSHLSLKYEGPGVNKEEIPSSAFRPPYGISYDSYLIDSSFQQLEGADFDSLTHSSSGVNEQIDLFIPYGGAYFAARFRGNIHIPTSGMWTFYLTSDDGSRFFMNNNSIPVIDNDGVHSSRTLEYSVYLDSGCYPIEVQYFNVGGDYDFDFSYSGPEVPEQKVPMTALMPHDSVRGLYYESYDVDLSSQLLAGTLFDDLDPIQSGISDQVNLDDRPQSTSSGSGQVANYAMRFRGYVYVLEDGDWTFNLGSDDGSRLYIGESDTPLIDNDGLGSFNGYANVNLRAGLHLIEVQYFNAQDIESLKLWYGCSDLGIGLHEIPQTMLFPLNFPQSGLSYASYILSNQDSHSNIDKATDDMARMFPANVGIATEISPDLAREQEDFGLRFNGYILIPTEGTWTFFLKSDDGSKLWLGEKIDERGGDGSDLYVDNGTYKDNGEQERQASAYLSAGYYPISIDYYQAGGDFSLEVEYEGPVSRREIPAENLFIDLPDNFQTF